MEDVVVGSDSGEVRSAGSTRRKLLTNAIGLGGAAAVFGHNLMHEANAQNTSKLLTATPNAFDLRKVGPNRDNYITKVQDQGDCNSCTAFAVVAAIEGSYNWQNNRPVPPGATTPGYSEAQLFHCNVPAGCKVTAWFPEQALVHCVSPGVIDRNNNPYDHLHPQNNACKLPDSSWQWTTLGGLQRLRNDNDMKRWISGTHPAGPGGPVIAVMVEYKDLRSFSGREITTYSPADDPSANPRLGGHVVCIVGYDDTNPNDKFWICKNSWGDSGLWNPGGNGYFRAKQEKPNERMTYIDSFDMWGIVVG